MKFAFMSERFGTSVYSNSRTRRRPTPAGARKRVDRPKRSPSTTYRGVEYTVRRDETAELDRQIAEISARRGGRERCPSLRPECNMSP